MLKFARRMENRSDNSRHLIRWRSIWLGWTLVGGFSVLRYLAIALGQGAPINWRKGIAYEFLFMYVWALCTPLVFAVARRVRLTNWWPVAWRHAPFAALIAGLQVAGLIGVVMLFEARGQQANWQQPWLVWRREAIYIGCTNLAIYAVLAGIYYGLRLRHERQVRETQLTARLAQAELQNLKMQLQPHFLFNTLHAIGVLMMRDAGTARRMLVRLSELLRLTLDHTATQEVPLKQELEFLAAYLEIERTRFQDKLNVQMEIEPATLDAAVPGLLLQPLVENAIRHGVARRAEAGLVVISATRQNGSLHLQVRDNGPGLDEEPQPGIGLATTQARLEQLYRAEQQFEITRAPEGGVCVTVVLPFRQAEES